MVWCTCSKPPEPLADANPSTECADNVGARPTCADGRGAFHARRGTIVRTMHNHHVRFRGRGRGRGRGHSGDPGELDLLAAARAEFLSPLTLFGRSRHVYGSVYRTEVGVYVIVAPHLGTDDPVRGVGWARNDFWAVQVWGFDGHRFHNDYDAQEQAGPAPSLHGLGWPEPLTYRETLEHAKRDTNRRGIVGANYRMTDGGFQSHEIRATDALSFHYDDPNPNPGDSAVAIEFRLRGKSWERHLSKVRQAQ